MEFPRIVHQIWYNFQEWGNVQPLPNRYETIRLQWQQLNPQWTFIVWNEKTTQEFLQKTFSGAVYEKFMSYKIPVQRADFFRWTALYYFGGCYIDTDCVPLKPLDTLLDRHFFKQPKTQGLLVVPLSHWAMNAMILSTPRHPAVARLISEMPVFGSESVVSIFFSTGPAIVRKSLQSSVASNSTDGAKVIIFDPDMMWHTPGQPGPVPTNRPFVAQHNGDGSWDFQRFMRNDIIRLVIAILVVLLIVTVFVGWLINQRRRWTSDVVSAIKFSAH